MFNNKKDNEADFCESYKSQILGSKPNSNGTSVFGTIVKLLTILILLAIIMGVSFYGYNYFINSKQFNNSVLPPVSMQISDDDLVVKAESEESVLEEKVVDKKEKSNSIPLVVTTQTDEGLNIDTIAKNVKIEIAKSEVKEENNSKVQKNTFEDFQLKEETNVTIKQEDSLEIPTSAPEAKYLEDLADLSKEIDKERKK